MNHCSFDIQSIFLYDVITRELVTHMIGMKMIRFDTVDSTNDFVKMNHEALEHGTIIVAKKQLKGRGRNNNVWSSESGNLYFSVIIKGNLTLKHLFQYVCISSLAIIKTLDFCGIQSSIKYPNDILVNQKKIAGILIESKVKQLSIDYLVVGVGINVNQTNFVTLNEKAISIRQLTNKKWSLDRILLQFIHYFNVLSEEQFQKVYDDYIDNSIVIGKIIHYEGEQFKVQSIEIDGIVVLENQHGLKRVVLNEISFEEIYKL